MEGEKRRSPSPVQSHDKELETITNIIREISGITSAKAYAGSGRLLNDTCFMLKHIVPGNAEAPLRTMNVHATSSRPTLLSCAKEALRRLSEV